MTASNIQNLKARIMKKSTSDHKDASNTLVFLSSALLKNPDDHDGVGIKQV